MLIEQRNKVVGMIDTYLHRQGKKVSKQTLDHLKDFLYRRFESDLKTLKAEISSGKGLNVYFNWLKVFKQIEHDIVRFVERLL